MDSITLTAAPGSLGNPETVALDSCYGAKYGARFSWIIMMSDLPPEWQGEFGMQNPDLLPSCDEEFAELFEKAGSACEDQRLQASISLEFKVGEGEEGDDLFIDADFMVCWLDDQGELQEDSYLADPVSVSLSHLTPQSVKGIPVQISLDALPETNDSERYMPEIMRRFYGEVLKRVIFLKIVVNDGVPAMQVSTGNKVFWVTKKAEV